MPLTKRQIFRRRRIAVFGGTAIVLAAGFYLPLTLLAPLGTVAAHLDTWSAPTPTDPALDFPAYGASGIGAVGYDGVLASAGPTTALPIASISKVVTALVVLQSMPITVTDPGPTVMFSTVDEGFYAAQLAVDGVVAEVHAGQQMSERNILDLMLMASANNYAESLVTWAFGTEAAYADTANAWLRTNGFASTVVHDATGIDPANVSSVADLINLGKRAIADPVIAQIVATVSLDVPGIGLVQNRNALVGIDGVDGIKTGTLDEAGSCLLFSARETVGTETITLVGVVLDGPDHPTVDASVRALIAQAVAGFHVVTLTTAGEQFATWRTAWGDAAAAVAAKDSSVVLWSNTPVNLAIDANPLRLAADGADVGTLEFTAGNRTISVQLELKGAIDDPGPWWRLANPTKLF
jgi:D-alanyl-D-alanine carboxypeptidase (penicillin-binding protein 5/6)